MTIGKTFGCVAVLGCVLLSGKAWAAGATTGGGSYTKFVAGSDKTYSWSATTDLNAARKAGKPIVLYVWDNTIKNNSVARSFELNVFPDKAVKDALQGFTYVMVRPDHRGWPLELLARGKEGAACYLMTCDGTVVGGWWKGNLPNAADFAKVAMGVAAGNQAAADRMAKKPPEKFEQKQPQEVAQAGGPGQPKEEEKKPEGVGKVPGLPGLGGEEKTAEAKKTTAAGGDKKKDKGGKLDDE